MLWPRLLQSALVVLALIAANGGFTAAADPSTVVDTTDAQFELVRVAPGSLDAISNGEGDGDSHATEVRVRAGLDQPFAAFGVASGSTHSAAHGHAEQTYEVRWRDASGWQSPINLPVDGHTPEGSGQRVSDPFWVGEAFELEVLLPEGHDLASTEVLLVAATEERVASGGGTDSPLARSHLPDEPPILSREGWSARAPSQEPVVADELMLGIVHHSVSANTYSSSEVPAMLRAIQTFHMDGQGWSDFAYNFVVDRFGRIWQGHAGAIDQPVIGGHAKGFNTGSVGVVGLGEFDSAGPSNAMVDALADVLAWKFFVHGVDPTGTTTYTTAGNERFAPSTSVALPTIVGHRDTGFTACPGEHLHSRLDEIVDQTRIRFAALTGPGDFDRSSLAIDHTGQPLVGDFNGDRHDDIFWYGPGSLADSLWLGAEVGFDVIPITVNGAYEPLVADFDGDWADDIFWYGSGARRDSLWLSREDGTFQSIPVAVQGNYRPLVGQFTEDDRADIFWYGSGAAKDGFWIGSDTSSTSFTYRTPTVAGFYLPVVADFDRNWRDDILWYGPGTLFDSMWLGTDNGDFRPQPQSISINARPTVLDANGDSRPDLLMYGGGSSRDELRIGRGDGGFAPVSLDQPLDLTPLVIDITGGGSDDLLWFDPLARTTDWRWIATSNGKFSVTSSGTRHHPQRPLPGDFNGDGRADLVWFGSGSTLDELWIAAD